MSVLDMDMQMNPIQDQMVEWIEMMLITMMKDELQAKVDPTKIPKRTPTLTSIHQITMTLPLPLPLPLPLLLPLLLLGMRTPLDLRLIRTIIITIILMTLPIQITNTKRFLLIKWRCKYILAPKVIQDICSASLGCVESKVWDINQVL
jgi:hypothetical protein